ncbi:hypothetical protein Nmel_016235 [Mimus melanotis]
MGEHPRERKEAWSQLGMEKMTLAAWMGMRKGTKRRTMRTAGSQKMTIQRLKNLRLVT